MRQPRAYVHLISWILGLFHRRIHHSQTAIMGNIIVRICPNVFNPFMGRTTAFFIRHMRIPKNSKVLELGTGTGAIAAAAAKHAKLVVATDINPHAVQCAQATMRLNNIENRVEILQGDLFSPVQERQFDVIFFNPPYLKRKANTRMAKAWCAGPHCELISKFIKEARKYLKLEGNIQILFSTVAPLTQIIQQIREEGFQIEILAEVIY
jgi:release factor glutamine methyltransferase